MTVAFDAKSLAKTGIAWVTTEHSTTTSHTATGSNVLAVVTVLVRRNEAVDPTVTVTYGEQQMESKGRVWLNNLPPSRRNNSFLEVFTLKVPAGTTDWTVTVSSGSRMTGEYKASCATYTGVARAGTVTTVWGTDLNTNMKLVAPSKAGRMVAAAFAHQSRTLITGFSGTSRYQLDLFLAISQGVVGDAPGAASVTITATRAWAGSYCGVAVDLIDYVATTSAKVSVAGVTPTLEVEPPPAEGITVLTLAPAFAPMDPRHLRGELFRYPYTRVTVPYKNFPLNVYAKGGMEKLDEYLHRYVGQKILVVTHSMGSQVVMKWLREKGPTSDIDPTEVTFICTGNPERKYNGFPDGGDYPGGPGGTGLPAGGTPYKVIDIARQYDFWADHPNDEGNPTAMRNVDPKASGLGAGNPVHLDYSAVSANPNDARNFAITEDTITYVWCPTYPAPLLADEDFFDTTQTLVPQDSVVREAIEVAYTRPVTLPDPPPGDALDERFPWGWDGAKWVRVSRASVDTPTPTNTWWMEA